jgi:hypothetical protein
MSITIPALQNTRVVHGLLIKIGVNGTDYFIANTYNPLTWNGDTYLALGHFLGINDIQNDIKITNAQIALSLSGIPKDPSELGLGAYSSFVDFILSEKIKGSSVKIYRAFFDPDNRELYNDQVSLRFSGYISNFTVTDNPDVNTRTDSYTVVVNCSSIHAVLERRVAGRRTNSTDQKSFYPSDIGMDRVVVISNTSFDFGKPVSASGNVGLLTTPTQEQSA